MRTLAIALFAYALNLAPHADAQTAPPPPENTPPPRTIPPPPPRAQVGDPGTVLDSGRVVADPERPPAPSNQQQPCPTDAEGLRLLQQLDPERAAACRPQSSGPIRV